MDKIIISLFDYTGNWSKPYLENGFKVIRVDIKNGIDILNWDYKSIEKDNVFGILAAIPCDNYALSGARWVKDKDIDGRTEYSQKLVYKTKEIIDFFDNVSFYAIENPMSRIHKLNPWIGDPKLKFNPCDYALYDPIPENSNYNKKTWLWGKFNCPIYKPLIPKNKEYPGFKKLGGKSERTKELRSITPLGFAYAFYEINH